MPPRISVRDRNSGVQHFTLRVEYDGREAYIDLPLHNGDRSLEAYRQELDRLLEALDQWENELGEVLSAGPPHRK